MQSLNNRRAQRALFSLSLVRSCLLLLLLLALSACRPAPNAPPPPTLTLIPATLRPTPSNIPLTPTVPSRIDPLDLNPTAQPIADAPPLPEAVQASYALARADLADWLSVPLGQVVLTDLREGTWFSADLGCGDRESRPLNRAIEGYRLIFQVDGTDYAYHTDRRRTVRRCNQPDRVVGNTRISLEFNPVAAEFVALARARVARQTETASADVELVDIDPYLWPDTSLGCPLPGNDYPLAEANGYRIVLVADSAEYIFHTSFTDIIRCAPGNEVLPG